MNSISVKIKIADAVQVQFFNMEKVYLGNVVSVILELRDPYGSLYTPNFPNPAVAVEIYQVDSDGNLGADPVMEVNATQVTQEDDSPLPGRFLGLINTRTLTADRYILRVRSPYGTGDVLAQADFLIQDPAVVAA